MDHADLVDGHEAAREAVDGVRRARGVEAEAGGAEAVLDALRERRPLGAAVHVLDDDPGEIDAPRADRQPERPRVDEAHDEGRGRDALVEAAERDRLFLDDQRRGGPGALNEGGAEHLHHHRRLALGRDADGVEDDAHRALADAPDDAITDAGDDLGGDDRADQPLERVLIGDGRVHARRTILAARAKEPVRGDARRGSPRARQRRHRNGSVGEASAIRIRRTPLLESHRLRSARDRARPAG